MSDLQVGAVVLSEQRLERLVRSNEALSIYAATSTVDGGAYTVAIAKEVAISTAATALEAAVAKTERHAIGVRGLVTVLHARPVDREEGACLGVVRRGEPSSSVAELSNEGPRSVAEIVRMLSPVADALLVLHDQGLAHGAVSAITIVRRGQDLALDFFGLGQAAEAADGARGTAQVQARGYRAPELAQGTPGPYSDVYALAVVAVELLAGTTHAGERAGDATAPTPRALGLTVGDRIEAAFEKALSSSPSKRPTVTGFLRDLAAAADDTGPPTKTEAPFAETSRELPDAEPSIVPAPAALQAASPAPRKSAPQPGLAPLRSTDESSGKLLGWSIAIGLLLFAAALGGTVAYVMTHAPATTASAAPPPLPVPPPPEVPTTTATPSPTVTAPEPPHAYGPPTYPADTSALLPVEPDAIVRGDRDAVLTVVVFGDLTDPFTARELALLPPLEAAYGGDLRVVYKHFPLPGRLDAGRAEEALAIAQAKSGAAGWKFIDLATHGGELDPGRLEDIGIKAGLSAGAITEGLRDHTGQKLVDRDVDLGRRFGVRGTPVMFFNGVRADGLITDGNRLRVVLDAEIQRAKKLLAKGSAKDSLYATRVRMNVTTVEGEKRPEDPR